MGIIRQAADRSDLDEPILLPILITYRGTRLEICPYAVPSMRPTGVWLPIDGHQCKEYMRNRGGLTDSCWFEESKEWTLRRLAVHKNGKLIRQVDVQYRMDEQ